MADSSKDRVREDISTYERQKKYKGLGAFGAAGGAGLAGYGAVAGKKIPLAVGLGGAVLGGFAHGRAKREEQGALNRIKRFYDLREKKPFTLLPSTHEKTAVVGGALEAITGILGGLGHLTMGMDPGSMTHWLQSGLQHAGLTEAASTTAAAAAPFAIDLAALPAVGKYVEKSTRGHANVAAKDTMGLPLSASEKLLRAKSHEAVAKIEQTKAMKPGIFKSYSEWRNQYRGPKATGGQVGESVGKVLKEVNKYSPTLATSALGATKDQKGWNRFQKQIELRGARYQQAGKILDSTIDEVPGLRGMLRFTGKGGQNLASQILENPRAAKTMAENLKKNVASGVRGTKMMLGALALAAAASAAGQYRPSHPLSKDKLPARLAEG